MTKVQPPVACHLPPPQNSPQMTQQKLWMSLRLISQRNLLKLLWSCDRHGQPSAEPFKLPISNNPVNTGASQRLLSLTWNLEGLKRNVYNLRMFTDLYHPQLLFLSEPQIFQSDLQNLTRYFKGEYTTVLNSEDLHNPDLMLTSTRAKGGTM